MRTDQKTERHAFSVAASFVRHAPKVPCLRRLLEDGDLSSDSGAGEDDLRWCRC